MTAQKLAVLVGSALLAGFTPGPAVAELFAAPSLLVAGVYDDNLFFSSTQPEEDRFLRVSPAIEAGYRSDPMTLRALYTADAERYSENSGLDSNRARERAGLGFRYEPDRSLTLLADVNNTETDRPSELLPEVGLDFQRVRVERFSAEPSIIYRINRLTTATAAYSLTRDEVVGEFGNETQMVEVGFDRQLNRRSMMSLRYRAEQFDFDTQESANAHVLLGGGTHNLTRRIELTLLAGPRFKDDSDDSEDSVEPEATASLRYRLERGNIGLVYNRTERAALGLSGTATTESVQTTFLWAPEAAFEVRGSAGYITNEHNGRQADVSIATIEAGYRLTDSITLVGSYGFSEQQGSLQTAGFGDITRNVVLFGLIIGWPPRGLNTESPRGVRMPSTTFGGPF